MEKSNPMEPYQDEFPEITGLVVKSDSPVADTPEPKDTALALVAKAGEVVVANQQDLTLANDLLVRAKIIRKQLDQEFDPGIKKAKDTHITLVAQKKKWVTTLDEVEDLLRPKIAAYLAEQRRIGLEADRKIQMAKQAMELEAQKASDKAHDLIAQGRAKEAEKVVAKAEAKIDAIQAAMPAPVEKAKANNTSLLELWDWDRLEVDFAKVPDKYKKLDEAAITAHVRTCRHQAAIPGIRIFKTVTTQTRVPK